MYRILFIFIEIFYITLGEPTNIKYSKDDIEEVAGQDSDSFVKASTGDR